MAPAGGAEADGKDGKDPGVIFTEDAEDPEEGRPHAAEEEDAEQGDLPWLRDAAGPEIAPVATVRGREPVVLDEDGDEEPEDDFAASEGRVEGWDGSGGLAVIVGKTEEEDETGDPHEDGDGDGYDGHDDAVADGADSAWDEVAIETRSGFFGEDRTPVPEGYDVGLLCALDDASSVDPGFHRCTTLR